VQTLRASLLVERLTAATDLSLGEEWSLDRTNTLLTECHACWRRGL